MTSTVQEINRALREAGCDVDFDQLQSAEATITPAIAQILLDLLPTGEVHDVSINLFFGIAAGRSKSDEIWWQMHSMVASGRYHGDAFLGLVNGLLNSFSWTAAKGDALLGVYLDPSLDEQRSSFIVALRKFPRAQRDEILERAARDPVLRPDVDEFLKRRLRRVAARKACGSSNPRE